MHFHGHHPPSGPAGGGPPPSLPLPKELSQDMRFLEPSRLSFRQQDTRLQFREEDEEEWQDVAVVRLFPLTQLETWISVLAADGKEIGILRDLKGLPAESLECVREALNRHYLVPAVQRILSCRERLDIIEWYVETDRGRATFITRNARENAQEPLPRRLVLTDVEGNRYDIPDTEALDPASRHWLEERL